MVTERDDRWCDKYEFSVRTSNVIWSHGITFDRAVSMADTDWKRLRGLGAKGLKEIRHVFRRPGEPESPASAYARGWADAMHAVAGAMASLPTPPKVPADE